MSAAAEAELRRLLHEITGSSEDLMSGIFAFRPQPIHYVNKVSLDRWIDKISRRRKDAPPPSPEAVARAKDLVFRMLNEMVVDEPVLVTAVDEPVMALDGPVRSEDGPGGLIDGPVMAEDEPVTSEEDSEVLLGMVAALRGVAGNSACKLGEWGEVILRAREVLRVSTKDVRVSSGGDGAPHPKKQKTDKSVRGSSTGYLSPKKSDVEWSARVPPPDFRQPTRRSKRTFGLLKVGMSSLPQKRIPLGESFQADVPEWSCPASKRKITSDSNSLDDKQWLGTQIWPVKPDIGENNKKIIGKRRPDLCTCSSPGSVDCISLHIRTSRKHLKSELGQAFFSLGFDSMGEVVSRMWTREEETMFANIVKQNPISDAKSFLWPALQYFSSKSRQDIISYYFNVFVLRRMRKQIRSGSRTVDSDDDEGDNDETMHYNDGNNNNVLPTSCTRYSQSCYLPTSGDCTVAAMCQCVTGNMLGPLEGNFIS